LYTFEPARPDRPVSRNTIRSGSLGWCAPSTDGAWLACTARSGQEDLVLLRSDGTETRRLTDDAFKDRMPSWSPDGRTLAFMSMRSGGWELWSIEADGSGLRQLTDFKRRGGWGVWSPDRTRMALSAVGTGHPGVWFIDPTRTATLESSQVTAPDSRLNDTEAGADTWSSDGALVAGSLMAPSGDPVAIAIFDARTRTLRHRFDLPLLRSTSPDVTFVSGTHLVLVNMSGGLSIVDADTGKARTILPVTPPFEHRLSGDGRTLLVERPGLESDVWLIEMGK
jgi:Tol biopolymer transport system component